MKETTRTFLEEGCPIEILSIESRRERGAPSALPPLYFQHIWWARRPLTVSRAMILGGLLPAGFPSETFTQLMGVPADATPVKDEQRIAEANRIGKRLKEGYRHDRAYTNTVPAKAINEMQEALQDRWGVAQPTVLDSFAGGGSIPFESVRLGLTTVSNDLNPVASIIQRSSIKYPQRLGKEFSKRIREWGDQISNQVEEKLSEFFPRQHGEEIFAYVWARTVPCDHCSLQVPLSPNWWLSKRDKLGIEPLIPDQEARNECDFELARKRDDFDPSNGTVSYGTATCPRCSSTLDGDFLKKEAREGRMKHRLIAVGYKNKGERGKKFREVTQEDLEAVQSAENRVRERMSAWESNGLLPVEAYPSEANEQRPLQYGMPRWCDFFNPRQLLVQMTILETLLDQPWAEVQDDFEREALRVYLAFAFDVCLNYNNVQTRWDPSRGIRGLFDRHDFSFKWSYGEFDGARELFQWGVFQQEDAYEKIADLFEGMPEGEIEFLCEDAASLPMDAGTVHSVAIDPPYYDNVMYSELSDFFYVWLKRSLGDVFPDLLGQNLTDKESEAVANPGRFREASGSARKLADRDYQAKMMAAFKEARRVLRDDGVMTVMFTHKRLEAWDTLGEALIKAGFEISATWPVHTESQHSLHQAKKNAAASTILIVCRKRSLKEDQETWWHEIQDDLRTIVRKRAQEFTNQGFRHQDVSIACFGPALQLLSSNWPVRRRDGTEIRPDEALDIAREEVSDWFFERIAEGEQQPVDKWTRFYVLGWYVFEARKFPYDEALKLARAIGVDLDDELIARDLLSKTGKYVQFQEPSSRFRSGTLDPHATDYPWDVDYIHAAIHAYSEGQSRELERFHQRTGAVADAGYRNAMGYLLDVLPRTDNVPEYDTLDKLWAANLRNEVERRRDRPRDTSAGQQQLDLESDQE